MIALMDFILRMASAKHAQMICIIVSDASREQNVIFVTLMWLVLINSENATNARTDGLKLQKNRSQIVFVMISLI